MVRPPGSNPFGRIVAYGEIDPERCSWKRLRISPRKSGSAKASTWPLVPDPVVAESALASGDGGGWREQDGERKLASSNKPKPSLEFLIQITADRVFVDSLGSPSRSEDNDKRFKNSYNSCGLSLPAKGHHCRTAAQSFWPFNLMVVTLASGSGVEKRLCHTVVATGIQWLLQESRHCSQNAMQTMVVAVHGCLTG
jgi:hypothetical protein